MKTPGADSLGATGPKQRRTRYERLGMPRDGDVRSTLGPDAQFGPRGAIATADARAATGGKFHPRSFNWMMHVYPFEWYRPS